MKNIFKLLNSREKSNNTVESVNEIREPKLNSEKLPPVDSMDAEILYSDGSRYRGGIKGGKRNGLGTLVLLTTSENKEKLSISSVDVVILEEIKTLSQYNAKWMVVEKKAASEEAKLEANNAIKQNHAILLEKIGLLSAKHSIWNARNDPSIDEVQKSMSEKVLIKNNNIINELCNDSNNFSIDNSFGIIYEGCWYDDLFQGNGTYIWVDGSKYEGEFYLGKICGKGKHTKPNGDTYLGFFHEGLKQGRGTSSWANGDSHVGYWWAGKINGKGKYTWANGGCFNGKFRVDSRSGAGTEIFPDGSQYTGLWKSDKIYGSGTFKSVDGVTYEGKWNSQKLYEFRMGLINSTSDVLDVNKSNELLTVKFEDTVSSYIEDQFDKLIGLTEVKNEIRQQANLLKIQQLRMNSGLKNLSGPSRHLIFAGNPGTGKTIFARIVAGMYMRLGILKTDKVIEVDRSGLVAGYIGHTAIKTKELFESALDGVLFIDEAYSLVKEGSAYSDFGQEAVETLLKLMEDNRERIVVIVAGYKTKMDEFISSNPGLSSRFNRYISFPNYSIEELWLILKLFSEDNNYEIDDSVKDYLLPVISRDIEFLGEGFGNARYIRNIFEKVLQIQATRLVNSVVKPTKDDLVKLILSDFEAAV